MKTAVMVMLAVCFSLAAFATQSQVEEKSAPPPPPPARKIPAITSEDRYPGGCVECNPSVCCWLSSKVRKHTYCVCASTAVASGKTPVMTVSSMRERWKVRMAGPREFEAGSAPTRHVFALYHRPIPYVSRSSIISIL